jgi:hypothetical protein
MIRGRELVGVDLPRLIAEQNIAAARLVTG